MGLLSLALASCSGLQDTLISEPEPSTASLNEPLNVEKIAGRWVVQSGDQDAANLWRSQNPMGETLSVNFADSAEPIELTIRDGHAFIGDMLMGEVRGQQVIGAQNRVVANLIRRPYE